MAAGIGILILGFLSLYSLFYTEGFTENRSEVLELSRDPAALTLALSALALALLFGAAKLVLRDARHRRRNIRVFLVFTCVYVAVFGFVWAVECRYYRKWDAEMVSFFANQLANGINDISAHDLDYISAYPHQIGLIAVMEQLYRFFGWENFRAFQALNALGAGGIVLAGYGLVKEISGRDESCVHFLMLMLSCWPLIIYVAFLYGEILSTFFSMLAVYGMLRYLKLHRRRDVLGMSLAVTAACLIRSNSYIVLAAMGCVLAVKAVSERTLRRVLVLLPCFLLLFLSRSALRQHYEERLGVDLDNGMPAIMWIAMSTQEGADGKEAGWYTGLAWDQFVDEAGGDREKATALAKETLAESAAVFRENPSYMLDFYKRKIVSQWCEPTYSALMETNKRIEERSALMDRVYKGDLWQPFVRWMDVYQVFVYLGATLFLLYHFRRRGSVELLCLAIAVTGGVLFSIIWEAKSRYTFPYFVMLIPLAAIGSDWLLQSLCLRLERRRGGRRKETNEGEELYQDAEGLR